MAQLNWMQAKLSVAGSELNLAEEASPTHTNTNIFNILALAIDARKES